MSSQHSRVRGGDHQDPILRRFHPTPKADAGRGDHNIERMARQASVAWRSSLSPLRGTIRIIGALRTPGTSLSVGRSRALATPIEVKATV